MVDWLHTSHWKDRTVLYSYGDGHGIEWNYLHSKGFYGAADNPNDCGLVNCDYIHFEEYRTLPPYWVYT